MRLMFGIVGIRRHVLLAAACIAAHDLVDATCGVHQLRLTRVEGVRTAGDFQLHEGISFALELDGFTGLASGTAQEHIAVAHVLEHYGAIVFGMKILFHFLIVFIVSFYLVFGVE